ncbi:MAG TPA: hypothetical protein VNL95_06840 [Dehalococcoidia bacterium]|nr:hypothetical protein [Dehalococcoidia bacterium]
MGRFSLPQAVILRSAWLLALASITLAFMQLAGGGVLLLSGAFVLWIVAAVTTLRRRPGLWLMVIAMPVTVYLGLLLTCLLMKV